MEDQANARRQRKNDRQRIYWANHRGEINEKRKERITCSCGMEICKRFLNQHMNNSLHKKLTQH